MSKKTKYLLLALAGAMIGIGLGAHVLKSERAASSNEALPLSANIALPNGSVRARVADSDEERTLGLSHFKSLSKGEGMLFLFPEPGRYPFWMKDMAFPIDIVWLSKSGESSFSVVYVAENIAPETYPNVIDPGVSADAVLELGAGEAFRSGTAAGAEILVR